jgi:hypothetical protein
MIILSQYAMDLILSQLELIVTAGNFAGMLTECKMALYTNQIIATPANVIGDFTQSSVFAAPYQDIVFGAPARSSDGGFAVQGALLDWVLASPYTPTTFYGYIVTTTGGSPVLLWSEAFNFGAFNFVDQYSAIQIGAQFSIAAGTFGSATYVY